MSQVCESEISLCK